MLEYALYKEVLEVSMDVGRQEIVFGDPMPIFMGNFMHCEEPLPTED